MASGPSLDRHDPRSAAIRSVFGAADEPEIDFTSVFAASDGAVWLGVGERGVRLVAPDGSRRVALLPDPARPERSLPARPVLAMAEDAAGSVWIGTTLGLYRSSLQGVPGRGRRAGGPGAARAPSTGRQDRPGQ